MTKRIDLGGGGDGLGNGWISLLGLRSPAPISHSMCTGMYTTDFNHCGICGTLLLEGLVQCIDTLQFVCEP